MEALNVVKAVVKDNDGALVFKRPLWVGIIGTRKDEVSSEMAYNTYLNRYDIEHFFRFGKQKLLLDAYQTPELEHEEYWWKFVPVAYVQLYLARQLADVLPKPWERYLPEYKDVYQKTGLEKTPSQTQPGFANILEMISTPAKPSVPRGNPKGRASGVKPDKRQTQPIHFKRGHQKNDLKKTISNPIENKQEKPNLNEIELVLDRLKLDPKTLDLSHSEFIGLLISSA